MATQPAEFPRPFRGIITPMVTPLTDRDALDVAGLERLVEHVLGGGVHGLFILGTTGEGPSLGYRLRCELIDRVCEQVAGRVPVLVGVTDASFVESVNLAGYAADAGAAALILSTPFYFPADQADLARYVEHIVAELPLPVFLYNVPSHTKLTFEHETVERLMQVPSVVGLKDTSGNMIYFHKLRRLADGRADWSLLIGPEELLAEAILLGGHGGINGGTNICPRLYVDLYQAAVHRDIDRLSELHARVMQIHELIYSVSSASMHVIMAQKCALSCLGICDDFMAEPFHRFGQLQRGQIQENLKALDLLRPVVRPV